MGCGDKIPHMDDEDEDQCQTLGRKGIPAPIFPTSLIHIENSINKVSLTLPEEVRTRKCSNPTFPTSLIQRLQP